MTRILLTGCCGRMGKMITDLVSRTEDAEIVGGADVFYDSASSVAYSYPVHNSILDCTEEADVLLDFSTATALEDVLAYVKAHNLPAVLCATGYSDEQLKAVEETSKIVPVLRSSNMSIGINLIAGLLEEISDKLLEAGFDCEIVEKHHNQKLDAPSGTAIALGESVRKAASHEYEFTYDRTERREKRRKYEIGFSAVRGGTIVGEHDVIFAGEDEVITLSHQAFSRAIFAKGALEAARFLPGKAPGMYSMRDVLSI